MDEEEKRIPGGGHSSMLAGGPCFVQSPPWYLRLNRKTICFSKNEEIHDNVIGMYIEKYYFKHGKFSDAVAA